jgi:hypothetical protein
MTASRREAHMPKTALRCVLVLAPKALLWVGAIAVAALAVACSDECDQTPLNPVSPSALTPASSAAVEVALGSQASRTVPRNVSGEMNGSFTFEMIPPYGFYDFIAHGGAVGTLTHLGLARMFTQHQAREDGTLFNTSFTVAAANGDTLVGTYDNATVTPMSADVGPFPWVFKYQGTVPLVICGGTGRFAGASGTINATFQETILVYTEDWSVLDTSVAWTLKGTVNY